MNLRVFATILGMSFLLAVHAQNEPGLEQWQWLLGKWEGEGSGKPGQGKGYFSFEYILNNKVIERKSHSEYPSQDKSSLLIHDDLMLIYPDSSGSPCKAIYFDNEGHVINYMIGYSDQSIIFVSEKRSQSPVFRLTYTKLNDGMLNTKFEFSQDGGHFSTYIEGKSKKMN